MEQFFDLKFGFQGLLKKPIYYILQKPLSLEKYMINKN